MANNWAMLQVILTEITGPNAAAYSGMTNPQVANALNTTMVAGPDKTSILSGEMVEVFLANQSEFDAVYQSMNAREQKILDVLMSAGSVIVRTGSRTRAFLASKFSVALAPSIRVALLALLASQISRAASLGLGPVKEAHVQGARGGAMAPLP